LSKWKGVKVPEMLGFHLNATNLVENILSSLDELDTKTIVNSAIEVFWKGLKQ